MMPYFLSVLALQRLIHYEKVYQISREGHRCWTERIRSVQHHSSVSAVPRRYVPGVTPMMRLKLWTKWLWELNW